MADDLENALKAAVSPSDNQDQNADLSPDDPLLKAVQGAVSTPTSHPSSLPYAPPQHHAVAPPSRWQKAGTPSPEPELTLGQTGHQFVQNFIPSAKEAGSAFYNAVTHPWDTLSHIGQLGTGFASQAAGALGFQQDPAQKAKTEQLVNAVENHYKQAYGSWKDTKHTFATDPVGALLDLSTVLGGAGIAAKAVDLPVVANVAAKAAEITNPVSTALKIAKAPISVIGKVGRVGQALESGASMDSLARAAEAGSSKNPALRQIFKSHQSGTANPGDLIDAVQNGVDRLGDQRSAAYIENMKAVNQGALPTAGYRPIYDALDRNLSEITYTDPTTGMADILYPDAEKALQQIKNEVDNYSANSNGTIESLDALKKKIGNIRDNYRGALGTSEGRVAYQKGTDMYNAVLSHINNTDPNYAKAMADYQQASDQITQMKQAFLGNRATPDWSKLSRILRANNNPMKASLLSQLAEQDPRIPFMIAGQELSQGLPEGATRKALELPLMFAAGHFGSLPLAAAHLVASSPRMMGNLNYGLGSVGRYAGRAATPLGAAAVVGAGHLDELQNPVQQPNGTISSGDPVFDRMLKQESGGHQFKPDGTPVTSPKGAIGAAQIMPSTGPAAAAAAGEPWDLNRLKNDAVYNVKLGRAYFHQLLKKFDGDIPKAVAAYNTGPGHVQQAVQAGGGNWISHLPFAETRNYVTSIMRDFPEYAASGGRIERKEGGKVGHQHLVDRLMKLANKAKRDVDQASKPLLQADDSSIAHALAVANRGI